MNERAKLAAIAGTLANSQEDTASLRETAQDGEGGGDMGNEIKALRTQNSLRERAELVADCRGSGMTVKAWCAEHGVTYSQYYRWQQKVYEAMQEPEFVEITAPASDAPSPAVSVKLRNASIEVYSGCNASLAAAVLRALSDA